MLIVHGRADRNRGPEPTPAALRELTAARIPHEVMLLGDEGHGILRRFNMETCLMRFATLLRRAFAEGKR